MTCAITTSFLGCIVTLSLYFRYIFFINTPATYKFISLIIALMFGCIPLFVSYKFENLLGNFYTTYRYTLYYIYVGCIILFSLSILRDALWLIAHKISPQHIVSPFAREYHLSNSLISLGIAIILTTYALLKGIATPEIKASTLYSDKITTPFKIAILSDLHIHRTINPQKIENIINKTNQENADIILLTGDIIDDEVNRVQTISQLLTKLKAKQGIYFVTGNHEFYTGYQETTNELKKLGFTFLENSGTSITPNIYLAGIPDWFSAQQHQIPISLPSALKNSSNSQYKILMSHTPVDFNEQNNFDLEISGHTHGGQIFPFHIFVKLANKYLSGLYSMNNNAQIYVSNGAGQWGPQMRFLAPSEISIITLQPKSK